MIAIDSVEQHIVYLVSRQCLNDLDQLRDILLHQQAALGGDNTLRSNRLHAKMIVSIPKYCGEMPCPWVITISCEALHVQNTANPWMLQV